MIFLLKYTRSGLAICLFLLCGFNVIAQEAFKANATGKTIEFGNEKLKFSLDYSQKAVITSLFVNGQSVIDGNNGIYSQIRTAGANYSSVLLRRQPTLTKTQTSIVLSNIEYGDDNLLIKEKWTFSLSSKNVVLKIDRQLSRSVVAEKVSLPAITFNNLDTWEGAYQDYGGLAWFYLFNKPLDTYGVHSSASNFWNSKTNNGLTIDVNSTGNKVAMDYSRGKNNQLHYNISIAKTEMVPRFDADTHRRLFVRDTTDVWAPISLAAGMNSQTISFSYFNFNERYGRGKLAGINQEQVSAVLNTIARIGVIDKQHFGGNSWHTPYGPICLHEQYIGQMGLAINDPLYLKGYRDCLDFYRDNAIKPDGRVWPRWAYSNEDMMPGEVTDKGFYEAQWGYLLDSNPDFVTNVAETYDQNGDKTWVKSHQLSCEKALDWILKRDSDNDGLVEMITDSYKQKRGSDWIDIIWAAYENAFVNAKLYRALTLWADVEKQLGNKQKEDAYTSAAAKLQTSFNKSTTDGGFWDEENQCYVHWLDKDKSVHGRNMVTPVNFMAISYGICTDEKRSHKILDDIEMQMQKEKLFFWPLCLSSYGAGEGNDWQFPFPVYENGDIFLSWGSVAVNAYASYKPDLAVKYVKNVLEQYAKDGLAFQRYGRAKQDGLGDDILSGNSLAVVGLYQSIYGINPKYNRLLLDPHLTPELGGTEVQYNYRGKKLSIKLAVDKYSVADNRFEISASSSFGYFTKDNTVSYFPGTSEESILEMKADGNGRIGLGEIQHSDKGVSWKQTRPAGQAANIRYMLHHLKAGTTYSVNISKLPARLVKSDASGNLSFDLKTEDPTVEIAVTLK